jgi:hypothetical protein
VGCPARAAEAQGLSLHAALRKAIVEWMGRNEKSVAKRMRPFSSYFLLAKSPTYSATLDVCILVY